MSNVTPTSDPAAWLARTMRKNPEGLLLLGAGLALLMRTGQRPSRSTASGSSSGDTARTEGPYGPYGMDGTREPVSDQARNAAEQVRTSVSNATEFVSRSATEVQNQAAETTNAAMQSGQRMVNSAVESGQKAMNSAMQSGHQVVHSVAAQPFLVALIGIGTGLALASLVPETEIEHRAFQDAGKTLANTAREANSRIVSATNEVGDKLAEAAAERGLNKDGMQELAGDLTDTFTNALGDTDSSKRGDQHQQGSEREKGQQSEAAPGSQIS